MKKNIYIKCPSGSTPKQIEPKVTGEVLIEGFQGMGGLAVEFRDRMVYPTTELGINLKLMTREPGRMNVGDYHAGIIMCDGDVHFTFLENAFEKKKMSVTQRNPHIYEGKMININRKDDGRLYPTFNRPHYSPGFTFQHFCVEAAEELMAVAGLLEKGEGVRV